MHQYIQSAIAQLNGNRFFKFISSIRLAVPVMLGLIISVAAGTIFESLHSAEYAKIAVYNSSWFYALLALLCVNIFSSMMSRYPWKKHHTGFVITHIGILTLLAGSFITSVYGIDGSLQIPEKQSNNVVIMSRLMLGYQFENSPTLNSVFFEKTLFEKDKNDLNFINEKIGHVIQLEKFIPFAAIERGYSGGDDKLGPVGISFGLKSQFFDVKEWLHSVDNPIMQMGPATIKIIVDDKVSLNQLTKRVIASPTKSSSNYIRIFDFKSKKEIAQVEISKLKKEAFQFKGIKIKLTQAYQRAIVSNNKIAESEDPSSPPSPAVELEIEKENQKLREVLYGKFPGFSLNQAGVFGLRLELISAGIEEQSSLPAGHPQVNQNETPEAGSASNMSMQSNIIEFHVNKNKPDEVRVELWKSGKKVSEKLMKEGDTFQTPWMGMQLFLGSIVFGSQATTDVRAVRPTPGKELPASAVFVKPIGFENGFWLAQGDVKSIQVGNRNMQIIFSNERFILPFSLSLEKFTKKDYPGTETPYSYESLVRLETDKSEHLISMNEPLKNQGFTLYQSSYILNPGQPPTTILSINRDPGRPIKYLGSIILSLGIIIFTIMRSRIYRNRKEVV